MSTHEHKTVQVILTINILRKKYIKICFFQISFEHIHVTFDQYNNKLYPFSNRNELMEVAKLFFKMHIIFDVPVSCQEKLKVDAEPTVRQIII